MPSIAFNVQEEFENLGSRQGLTVGVWWRK